MLLHPKLPDARAYWKAKTNEEQQRKIIVILIGTIAALFSAVLARTLFF